MPRCGLLGVGDQAVRAGSGGEVVRGEQKESLGQAG